MHKKRKVYSNTGRYQKCRRKGHFPAGLLLVLFLAGLTVLCRMPNGGGVRELRELFEVILPPVEKMDRAIETLGRTFSVQNDDDENAMLVFGRMILGLEGNEDTAENVQKDEIHIPKSHGSSREVIESVSPIMEMAELAEQWTDGEVDDSTVNHAFKIPSPDIVDEEIYPVSRPFCMPLAKYRVTSRFGYRIHPISGNTTFHYGADLAAGTGVKVMAVADGTIRETGYGNINGNYVKMTHADGYASHYTHLHTISVSEGQKVTAGQQLGTVGSTGYSTGPHLHFELRKDGKILDPFAYFRF